jgi:hypothetical protein
MKHVERMTRDKNANKILAKKKKLTDHLKDLNIHEKIILKVTRGSVVG